VTEKKKSRQRKTDVRDSVRLVIPRHSKGQKEDGGRRYAVKNGRWKTTRAVAHATRYHQDDSKVGQEAAAREEERETKLRRLMTVASEFQYVKLCVSVMYTVVLFFLVMTSV